jgi:CRISPR type IV-associated protein Csf2
MAKFIIEGVLRTVTPLHISTAGGNARYDMDTGYVVHGDKGFPLTTTAKSKMILSGSVKSKNADDSETDVSRVVEYPSIPATTIRGMLRRGAASVIEDHFAFEKNEKISYQAYMGMRCGAVSGKPDGTSASVEEILNAKNHVIYGIFGGGPRMLRGNLRAQDALPITLELIEAGLISQRFYDYAVKGLSSRQMYSYNQVVRKDDFIGSAAASSRASEVVEGFDDLFAQKRKEELQRKADKAKDDKNSDSSEEIKAERGVQALSFREDVIQGLPFLFRLALDGTEAQVGLLLNALERSLNNGIGGRDAIGRGQLAGSLKLIDEDGKAFDALSGDIDNGFEIKSDVEHFMSAKQDAIDALTIENLNSYMLSFGEKA